MSTRKTRELHNALLSKGFEQVNTDHEMYYLSVEGQRTSVRTKISHGANEYGDPLLGQMARQMKLARNEFEDFIDCPLTKTGYKDLLIERGIVVLDDPANS